MQLTKRWSVVLILLFPLFGIAQKQVNIIPKPLSLIVEEGHFTIDKNTGIIFNSKEKDLHHAAIFFNSFIKNVSAISLPFNVKKNKSIIFEIKKTAKIGDEGYLLTVSPSSIKIVANTKPGLIYGMQSLFQTLPQVRTNATLEVPCMKVTDYPAFKWRGMHLDVCRHFFSPEMVKEYIDLLS
jgi:hexosaminidase